MKFVMSLLKYRKIIVLIFETELRGFGFYLH